MILHCAVYTIYLLCKCIYSCFSTFYVSIPLSFPGNACRMKVIKVLRKDFKTINDAEEAYGIDYFGKETYESEEHHESTGPLPEDLINSVVNNLGRLSPQQRIQLATHVYSFVAENDFNKDLKYFIPANFIKMSLHAISHLKDNGKDNVVYDLCKCLGELREDGMSARMDVNRMPFGLIAFNCKFFAVDDASNLHASDDYMQWMQSMYSHFGNSWASLHLGPMWSYNEVKDQEKSSCESGNIIAEALASVFDGLTIPDWSSPVPSDMHSSINSPGETTGVPTATEVPTPTVNPELPHEHEECLPLTFERTSVPSVLWSGISPSEREELLEADASPREIAAMFNVNPKQKKSVSRKRKTMDVSLFRRGCLVEMQCPLLCYFILSNTVYGLLISQISM